MEHVTIRVATPNDFKPLIDLARLSYLEHYTQIWTPENLDRYLDYAYSEQVFKDFLTENDTVVWVAESQNRLLGYLVFKKDLPLSPDLPNGCQIKRLYFLAEATGKGLGRAMLDIAISEARTLRRNYIWLDVMKCSPEAISFYKKAGFIIHSDKTFTLIPFRTPELSALWNMILEIKEGI